ncbi:5'-3' exoribonuclease 3 [Platanthera zijinensis]|uniref:5'-3' exoribonuclease 3 n=1 Tax=Platanthera zijinensis TaxID=2320716 RepID=A0AAP0G0X0_9ASPA
MDSRSYAASEWSARRRSTDDGSLVGRPYDGATTQSGGCVIVWPGGHALLNIWTFREYLELDMKTECQSIVDIERIVDDLFSSFFYGNDFLPHLPSIEIHEVFLEDDIEAVTIRMEEQFIKYGKGRIILEDEDEGNRWLLENPFQVRSEWEQHTLDRRGHLLNNAEENLQFR